MARRDHAEIIRALVDAYRLEVAGVKFWAPYWVNNHELMAAASAPNVKGAYKGKGTPGQLSLSLRNLLERTDQRPNSSDDYRSLMRAHGLGIDCSGFVYYVLNGWLRAQDRGPLAQQLVVSRDDVLAATKLRRSWQRHHVSEAEVKTWPELVPLAMVCRRFHKDPRMLTAVSTLVHPSAVNGIVTVGATLSGDMIKLTSEKWGDHIAVVVERRPHELIIAESTEPADALGGVGYSKVPISNPQAGLEDQAGWKRSSSYHPGDNNRDGIWRLRAVAG